MEAIPISILAKISEYLVAPIGRQLSYLFQLSGNVETLKNELENLGKLRADVEPKVRAAENNVETISNEVTDWLKHVDSVKGKAQRIFEDKNRFPKGCLNIKSRYGLSRRAKKRTHDILTLQQKGKFTEVSIPAPPILFIGSTSTSSNSRELKLEEIIENLKDQNISMIGICGMGGVGKTTMVKEVFKKVKKKKMFDDYAMTVVSQKPDMVKVQRDIAEMLGLRLEENNPVLIASRLKQRLDDKKVLIILDDVWDEFILEDLGFTLQGGQMKCKIVFTSRNQGLWRKFRSRRELSLDPLPFNESWNLFEENIGVLPDDKFEFVSIAEKIVRECAGLPLALVTLGSALLGKELYAWKDTLLKLEKIPGGQAKVYESIRQSYDYLGYEEAKSLFLICSLFEEDSQIFVESLVNMGMGLRLFEGINSVEEARNRVFTLVEHLQSRSLVTKKEAYITVHDVVRDVSKHIASTENGSLVLEQGVTWERSLDKTPPMHCTRISIISNKIKALPSQLRFPILELLRSTNEVLDFPDSGFEGMVKLQVLDINLSKSVQKLPSSLQSLTNLHTLCLQNCRLEDFSAIKFLQSLEILRITDYYIEELPNEIGQLTKLRLLDMSYCSSLKRIPPGIISCLTVLEELYLGGLDINWGAEDNEEGRIAVHREFESLSNLYILHIVIKDPSFLPLFTNLKKYHIHIGDVESFFINSDSKKYERTLSISGVALVKNFKFFVHHSEVLLLKASQSLGCELVLEASQSIKYLLISKMDTPEYLANVMDCTKAPFLVSTLESLKLEGLDNLQQIIKGPLVPGNFVKLKKLVVSECKQLRNIFRLSNAVDVLHLEELWVSKCESMEEIICWEGREEEANMKLHFPNLKYLKIDMDLSSIISFCKGANEIEFHQLEYMELSFMPAVECIVSNSDENRLNSFFPPKVLFPKLVMMNLWYLTNMKEIWCGQPQAGSFCTLAELHIWNCDSLEYAFSPCMARYLVRLHTLSIDKCQSLKEVVAAEKGIDGEEYSSSILPELKFVILNGLPALRIFCHIANDLKFPELRNVEVKNCPEFKTFASKFVHTPNLNGVMIGHEVETLWKENLNSTIQHLYEDSQLALAELLPFEKLKRLYVSNCKQPRNICRLSTTLGVLHSEELHVEYSESMADVSSEGREEEANRKSQFPKLKDLVIDSESIICFCKGATEIEFHQLGKMILSSIPAVECITSISDENPMNSIFPPKVFFPSLVKMELSSMPNMKKIWCGQPQVGSFCNLAKLYILECDSLEYVFSPCMARYLVHLHTLCIGRCRSLKEVVAAEKDKDVEEYSNSILPKLQVVVLDCLSALGKFCHIAKDLEFPVLEVVGVVDCPEFKTFAPGFVHTPNLEHVLVDYELETLWKEDLNNIVQHLYEDQQQRRQKQEDEKEGDNDNEINEDS